MSKVLYFNGITLICPFSNTISKSMNKYLTRYKSICIMRNNTTETNVSENAWSCEI